MQGEQQDLRYGLASVLASVLVINALEVVRAWPDVVKQTLRDVRTRIVVLFPELKKSKNESASYRESQ